MKIEWLDIALMYIMAFILAPLLAYSGIELEDTLLFYILEALLFAIPLAYYFTKNHCDEKQTAAVATLIGFTLVPFSLIPAAIFHFQLSDFIIFIDFGEYTFPLKIVMNGIFTIIASLFMWYANKNLIPKITLRK